MHQTQDLNKIKPWRFTLTLVLAISVTVGCNRRAQSDSETPAEMAGAEVDAEPDTPTGDAPTVTSEPTYSVLEDLDITYGEGLAHDETSATPRATPLKSVARFAS